MFFWILFFEPKSPFCEAYSLSIVANFGHFQKLVIFRILAVFWSRFLHRVTLMRSQCRFFACFLNFYFLSQSHPFAKPIAFPWWPILAIFKNLSFFRILGIFWSRFLHRVTLMRSQCRFWHVFLNFIFLAKFTLLQSL